MIGLNRDAIKTMAGRETCASLCVAPTWSQVFSIVGELEEVAGKMMGNFDDADRENEHTDTFISSKLALTEGYEATGEAQSFECARDCLCEYLNGISWTV